MLTTSEGLRELSVLSEKDLEAELATLAAHLNAGTCRWLELVGELDRRSGWAGSGLRSCAEWIAWRCALAPRSAREQQEAAHLSVFWNHDGSLEIHGRLAPEDGALVLRALESARDSLWRGSAEPRPARQASNADALVAIADAALASDRRERTGGERYQVVVHADEAALSHDGNGGCELEDGSALAPETVRRLACDASVVRDGRKSRTIPPALRRALRARDRGCRFPGCESRRFVDAHHVHHWAHGGETALDNLVLLCRRHHRLVHEGGYRVDHEGRFYCPWGGELESAPRLPRARADDLLEPNCRFPIGPDTCAAGTRERLDLAYAVDWMFEIDRWASHRAHPRK